MLAETYVRVEGAFPLIGVGGIAGIDCQRQAEYRVAANLVIFPVGSTDQFIETWLVPQTRLKSS
jgi:hypothetical protein